MNTIDKHGTQGYYEKEKKKKYERDLIGSWAKERLSTIMWNRRLHGISVLMYVLRMHSRN